jgi:hypothetical protein
LPRIHEGHGQVADALADALDRDGADLLSMGLGVAVQARLADGQQALEGIDLLGAGSDRETTVITRLARRDGRALWSRA